MKYLSTLFLSLFLISKSFAAPGDTTWVYANDVRLNYFNNFDTTINFPDGSTKYRKIIMYFTLGKYVCPTPSGPPPHYCADWDYTVQTFAMNKVGDTVELGRLITPYANSLRMTATWTQDYIFDVSDFATVLRDSNKIRIHYSGYSGGFTGKIRFAMIEGTPERDVISVQKMWNGSFAFGNAANPIDPKVAAKTVTPPTGTVAAMYRFNITGHGADANGCSEFCEKYYQVFKDGSLLKLQSIWRDNCGFNEFYPQNGTWIYDRGNWCPGDLVHTNFHPIPSVTAGTAFDLSMMFEPYTVASPSGSYTVFGNIIFYGAINKSLDASIDDIIAPTNFGGHFRENNRIGFTTIKIRNTGSSTINNVEFEYGVTGQPLTTATWTGTLAPLSDTIIDLPVAYSLLAASGANNPYEVNILKVNGSSDDDATNNKLTSTFDAVEEYASSFYISFRTNASNSGGLSHTEWTVSNVNSGAIVSSRTGNAPNTTYTDTLALPTGIYKLTVSDAGCDGLNWWANKATAGVGYIQVKETLFKSYTLKGYFGGDFGCGFTQYFRVGAPTAIRNINTSNESIMSVYPNPANESLNIVIEGAAAKGTINITDNLGKTIISQKINQNILHIATSQLPNGLYFAQYIADAANSPKLISKFIVLK